MKASLTNAIVQSENHYVTHTINSNLPLIQESKEERIKNHLTSIMAYAELILSGKMGPVRESQRKKIEVIRSEAKRMNFLLKTYKKEDAPKSSFIKNEIAKLELKLALPKKVFTKP